MTGQTNSLNSSTASLPDEDSSWVDLEIKENQEEKERHSSGDSGVEDQPGQESSAATTLEFKLTKSLLSQVRAEEDNKGANSGTTMYVDLTRMAFIINNRGIHKEKVKQWCESSGEDSDYRMIAKRALIEMFKSVHGAEVPNDSIVEELITNCNQAGYDGSFHKQLQNKFVGCGLILGNTLERTINIDCYNSNYISIKYNPSIPVCNFNNPEEKICELDSSLEFTVKLHDGKVEYENGKVTFKIPEELKKYHTDGKNLLDDVSEHFTDADNSVMESLIGNIGEGPKSFIVDPIENSDDEGLSFIEVSGNLADLEELVKKAVEAKDVSALNSYVKVVEARVTSVQPELIDRLIQILTQFARQEDAGRNGAYPTVPVAAQIYTAIQYTTRFVNGNISDDNYKIVQDLISQLERLLENRNVSTASPIIAENVLETKEENHIVEDDLQKKSNGERRSKASENLLTIPEEEQEALELENNTALSGQELTGNNSNEFLTNNCEEGKMGKNRKSGLNNKYSNGKKPASRTSIPTKKHQSKKEVDARQVIEIPNEELLNAQVKLNAAVNGQDQATESHVQPIEQEIRELMNDMVEIVSNDQATSSGEDQSTENPSIKGVENDNNNGDKVIIEDVVDEGEPVVSIANANSQDDSRFASGSNQHNTQPKTLATNHEPNGVIAESDNIEIPVSEQANDTHGDNEQHSDPKENNTTSKSAQKSKLPIIAISTLTIAAVASVALSIYFEMLMIGLAVGACCLVAAAIVYCCKPASLLEDSNAKASANSVPVVQ